MKAVVLCILGALVAGVRAVSSGPTVQTTQGPVEGFTTPDARVWLGIPFAAPPVGSLRWKEPVEHAPWTTPFKATQFGPGCPQQCNEPPFVCPTVLSEDCLQLNVFTPRNATADSRLPVLVFWSGGNYKLMTAGTELYYSDYFSKFTNMVIVTANYRLGALGFLATKSSLKGNFGIYDEAFGLKWVRDNIGAFGGDAQQVTISGQSAGAGSVMVAMTSPVFVDKGALLYQRAIMMSNPVAIQYQSFGDQKFRAVNKKFAEFTNCTEDDLSCYMSKSWQEILQAQVLTEKNVFPFPQLIKHAYMWSPTVGGDVLADQPMNLVNDGKFHKVPTMLGTLTQEGVQFIVQLFPELINKLKYEEAMDVVFGLENSKMIRDMYALPANETEDARPTMWDIATDYVFECGIRQTARSLAKHVPTYLYKYRHAFSFAAGWSPKFLECYYRVCHGSELPILYKTAHRKNFEPTADENRLSDQLEQFWAHFAKGATGDMPPLAPSTVHWPRYAEAHDQLIELGTPDNRIAAHYNQEKCDMWDKIGYLKF